MEGDRGTRAISWERVAGFDIVGWDRDIRVLLHTRMHRKRE